MTAFRVFVVGALVMSVGLGSAVPEAQVVSVPPVLAEAAREAASLPRLHSLLVSRGGTLLLEGYYHGARATRLANVKSVAKSVVSALVGIAIDRGALPGVRAPIQPYFADLLRAPADAAKRAITVEDLLTMRSGLETTSNRNYGAWVQSANWVRFALAQPLLSPPGTEMDYSTGNTHLLSALLTKATGKSTLQFAQETLATPLGFTLAPWTRDPQGIYFGGNEMLMTPRQMIRFGELYLDDGRAGDRQLITKDWVDRTQIGRGRSRWGSDREYGYGFWIRDFAGHKSYYAWGYGGQFIFIVPHRDLVIVTTSRSDVSQERRDHLDALYSLALDIVLMY